MTRRLTRTQRNYLHAADSQGHLPYGWGGYTSTQTVRILEERGYVILGRNHCAARWCITGLTSKGRDALAQHPAPVQ
jgi:hypothetical protein